MHFFLYMPFYINLFFFGTSSSDTPFLSSFAERLDENCFFYGNLINRTEVYIGKNCVEVPGG
jgi:hypothetical protein